MKRKSTSSALGDNQQLNRPRYNTPLDEEEEEEDVEPPLPEAPEEWNAALLKARLGQPFYRQEEFEEENPEFQQTFASSDYVVPDVIRQLTREYTRTYQNLQQKCRRHTKEWTTCADIFRHIGGRGYEGSTIDSCALECILNNLPTHAEYTVLSEQENLGENSEEDEEKGEEIKEPIAWTFTVRYPQADRTFQIRFTFDEEKSSFYAVLTLNRDVNSEEKIDLTTAKDLLSYYADRAEIIIQPELSYGSESDFTGDVTYSSILPSSRPSIDRYKFMQMNPRMDNASVTFYTE